MEERVQGKPPNPSYPPPCSLHSALDKRVHINFSQKLPEGWGIQNPPPIATNGSNYTRGFHIFILILRLIGYIFRNQKAELWVEQFAARSGLNVRTFFTEKHLWPIKHISEYISMFSVEHEKFFKCSETFQFQQTTHHLKELLQLPGQSTLWRWIIFTVALWVRFFLPTQCTHGPGEDPFEAVMCAVGDASQISCCLLRTLFLRQNITCNLGRISC